MSAAGPLVSVLIPAYNAELWIGECLQSVLDQTYAPLEIIVVDDGSTDATLRVAEGFTSRGVKVLSQSNAGAASARNRALRDSTGAWIQFLDADDLLHPEKIALQMRRALELGPGFLYSAEWGRFTYTIEEAEFAPSDLLADSAPVPWLVTKYARHDMVQPGAWLAHRSLLERAGPWDERMMGNDDGEFFDRAILCSKGVRFVPGARSFYRCQLPGSLSRVASRRAAEANLLALDLCTERLLRATDSEAARRACAVQYRLFAYQFYPRFKDLSDTAIKNSNTIINIHVDLPGSRSLGVLSKIFGWKLARILQYYYYKMRYE